MPQSCWLRDSREQPLPFWCSPCQTGLWVSQVTAQSHCCSPGHQAVRGLPASAQTEGMARLWGRWKRELIVNLELSVHAWMLRPEWLPQLRFRTCQVRKRRLFFPAFQYTLMFLLSSDSSVTVCHWKALHCIHYRKLVPKCNNTFQ